MRRAILGRSRPRAQRRAPPAQHRTGSFWPFARSARRPAAGC